VLVPVTSVNSQFSIPEHAAVHLSLVHRLRCFYALALQNQNRTAVQSLVHGQFIALLDDVLDSGETAKRAVKAIRAAGGKVTVFASVTHSRDFVPEKLSNF
jgi:predicted amidophosphoribosyltransferase